MSVNGVKAVAIARFHARLETSQLDAIRTARSTTGRQGDVGTYTTIYVLGEEMTEANAIESRLQNSSRRRHLLIRYCTQQLAAYGV